MIKNAISSLEVLVYGTVDPLETSNQGKEI